MEAQVVPLTTILTLQLAADDQAHFERLRQLHFPAALNRVPAHVSLFHTLPPLESIHEELQHAADRPAFTLRVTGVRSLGRGVAYVLQSAEASELHSALASTFATHLSPQDRQPFKPHVVVQNKVQPEAARLLKASLEASFQPLTVQAIGLTLWSYLNGPWQRAAFLPFRPAF